MLLLAPSASACTGFLSALPTTRLNVARYLHYHKIVENEFYVSLSPADLQKHTYGSYRATLRNGFLRCLRPLATATPSDPSSCSSLRLHLVCHQSIDTMDWAEYFLGPRFALVGLWYALTRKSNSSLPKFVAGVGIFRTLTCGGWTYVTSTDDHDWHDIFMISYLVATLPWTLGCLALSPRNPTALRYRKIFAGSFFATLVPLIYFFIQHKVHHVAGGMS